VLFHKSRILYGFDRAKLAIRKHNCAVLVEGQMDLLASHQAGWGNTVAVSGTAFTPEHASLIRRMTENLVIALDADEAGIKAAGRAARAALQGGLNVKVAQLPQGSDPAALILKEGKEAWSSAIREAKDIITFLLDVLEEHSKGKDRFRRAVESIVLPFLSDVRSPIAREQYQREIARRLDVSEAAVAEALSKVPTAPSDAAGTAKNEGSISSFEAGKIKQAFSLLLWQESLPKPDIDLRAYRKEFEEAVGDENLKLLHGLPESERESLRFSAESIHGKSFNLKREAQTLLRIILQERLALELAEATSALKRAESDGNSVQADVYMSVCKLLTTQIAQLHENM
jgi:DNA primase